MLIKDKDITSYQYVVNKTRLCACKLRTELRLEESGIIFFFTVRKKWVGRAMGNQTFYWDDLRELIFFRCVGRGINTKACDTVEPRYKEGPRDWQNLFIISTSFSIYLPYNYWGKKNRPVALRGHVTNASFKR